METSPNAPPPAESRAQPEELKLTDKNLKLVAPYTFVIDGEDIDDFWDSYLPEVTKQNEWFHATDARYREQGSVNIIDVGPDDTIISSRQILAPSKRGSLSVIDDEAAKEFIIEAEDEHGTVYLFNYYNGFTAFKEGKDGDWECRIKDSGSYEKLIAAAREYIVKHHDKMRMDYDFRSRYYFCKNGMLAHEGSSGAGNSSYSYFTYKESKRNLVEAVI